MSNPYEANKILAEYLLFHYGAAEEILPLDRGWPAGMHEALDFPARTAAHFSPGRVARGLDLGCAVGRATFEMALTCDEVVAMDFSHAFIQAAETLRQGGTITYNRREEAALSTPLEAKLPTALEGTKVRFFQGDAMDLPTDLGAFERVHAANLLCRLPRPRLLLDRLPDLVKPGGELVLATPCTWLEEFTPPENWPDKSTSDWLHDYLIADFELVRRAEEPFLIRETARKFQWTTSLVTVWRRRG
ncbi:MAG: putative 4-mercaptohistidine N1-methyltransferase [Akkermansiaceae bacterium]